MSPFKIPLLIVLAIAYGNKFISNNAPKSTSINQTRNYIDNLRGEKYFYDINGSEFDEIEGIVRRREGDMEDVAVIAHNQSTFHDKITSTENEHYICFSVMLLNLTKEIYKTIMDHITHYLYTKDEIEDIAVTEGGGEEGVIVQFQPAHNEEISAKVIQKSDNIINVGMIEFINDKTNEKSHMDEMNDFDYDETLEIFNRRADYWTTGMDPAYERPTSDEKDPSLEAAAERYAFDELAITSYVIHLPEGPRWTLPSEIMTEGAMNNHTEEFGGVIQNMMNGYQAKFQSMWLQLLWLINIQ